MASKPAVYIDSSCFIEMVKHEVGKGDKGRANDVWFSKKLLEASRDGAIDVYTSTLTIAECQHAGDGDTSTKVREVFSRLLMSGKHVKLVQATPFIAEDARDLRWRHGILLKGADAIHVASAAAMKCTELLAHDGKIQKQAELIREKLAVRVITPGDTALLPAEYRQENLV